VILFTVRVGFLAAERQCRSHLQRWRFALASK